MIAIQSGHPQACLLLDVFDIYKGAPISATCGS